MIKNCMLILKIKFKKKKKKKWKKEIKKATSIFMFKRKKLASIVLIFAKTIFLGLFEFC